MARKIRKTAILAKIETTYGTDAVPTGAANAILISNATFEIMYNNVDRSLIRGYFGASEQLAGTRFVKATFDVEISGSGTAGTAPAWGPLLRGCAMAETVSVGQRVEYNPVTDTLESLTIYYVADGAIRVMLGCRGTMEMAMGEGERPLFKFSFTGLDGGVTAGANPTQTLTAWKAPLVITDPNSGDIKLGGTYATGAITGGTAYPSRGLQLSLGNDVRSIALLGGQRADISDRAASGSVQLELTAAQEVTLRGDVNANTLTSLSFEHGTTAGYKVLFYAPKVQRINPKDQDYEGDVHTSLDLRLTPDAGNDELLIVAQ
jgi:hypothetical protein